MSRVNAPAENSPFYSLPQKFMDISPPENQQADTSEENGDAISTKNGIHIHVNLIRKKSKKKPQNVYVPYYVFPYSNSGSRVPCAGDSRRRPHSVFAPMPCACFPPLSRYPQSNLSSLKTPTARSTLKSRSINTTTSSTTSSVRSGSSSPRSVAETRHERSSRHRRSSGHHGSSHRKSHHSRHHTPSRSTGKTEESVPSTKVLASVPVPTDYRTANTLRHSLPALPGLLPSSNNLGPPGFGSPYALARPFQQPVTYTSVNPSIPDQGYATSLQSPFTRDGASPFTDTSSKIRMASPNMGTVRDSRLTADASSRATPSASRLNKVGMKPNTTLSRSRPELEGETKSSPAPTPLTRASVASSRQKTGVLPRTPPQFGNVQQSPSAILQQQPNPYYPTLPGQMDSKALSDFYQSHITLSPYGYTDTGLPCYSFTQVVPQRYLGPPVNMLMQPAASAAHQDKHKSSSEKKNDHSPRSRSSNSKHDRSSPRHRSLTARKKPDSQAKSHKSGHKAKSKKRHSYHETNPESVFRRYFLDSSRLSQ